MPVNLDKETADQFKSEILALIVKEVSNERKRAVELCKKRAELWKNSMGSQNNAPKIARDEARSLDTGVSVFWTCVDNRSVWINPIQKQ